ncbi:hypothetical protein [Thermogemmatispora onikobensis]|uniref:hypothetical protein n=1 Tax=Thermogemmatispora onikobensis TaxID=732234 RepID=UPI00085307C0|nr:hypothetical protein [Thermogemmatispora onikobensis]
MTQVPSDHDEAGPQEALVDLTKKLRKRERRLLQRLQKAQTARAKAVERLNRAQARLEKRTARLQRLEERLVLVRQQLQTLEALSEREPGSASQPQAAQAETATTSTAGAESSTGQDMKPAAATGASAEAGEIASGSAVLSELQALTHLLLEEGRREEQLRAGWGRSGPSSSAPADAAKDAGERTIDQTPAASEPEISAWLTFDQDQDTEPGARSEPDWVSQLAAGESNVSPTSQESLSELPAAHVAGEDARSQRPVAEQTSLQQSSAMEARQASSASAPPAAERPHQAALYGFDEPPDLPEAEGDDGEADFSPMTPAVLASSLLPASPAELVREARAAAEAAEEAARLAIERAALAAARLELLPSGRHLVQELAEVEQAVAQASHAAEVAQTTAREVEHWAQAIAPAADQASAPAQSGAFNRPAEAVSQHELQGELALDSTSETDAPAGTAEEDFPAPPTTVESRSETAASAASPPSEETQADPESALPQEKELLAPTETASPAILLQTEAIETSQPVEVEAMPPTQASEAPPSTEESAPSEVEPTTSSETTAPNEVALTTPDAPPISAAAEEQAEEKAADQDASAANLALEEAAETAEATTAAHQEMAEQAESAIPEATEEDTTQQASEQEEPGDATSVTQSASGGIEGEQTEAR